MNKYPKVNYIGNKEKLAEWIIEKLPVKNGIVLDLFCGGCSVSYALKVHGFDVISNDVLFSNFVIAKAIVENNYELLSYEEIEKILDEVEYEEKYSEISFLSNKLYFDEEVKELAKLVSASENMSGYKKFLFLALLRRAMIRKIPYSRMNIKWSEIQKLRDEDYSYKKYGRYRHYHNVPFIQHIRENIQQYNASVIGNNTKCIAVNYDARECLEKLDTMVDVIYMDPPYPSTMNQYADFYGDFDVALGKEVLINTDLTNKDTFLVDFSNLVKSCIGKSKYIAISLNNKSYPSSDLILQHISQFIEEHQLFERRHIYKVTGKENKKNNLEILLVCRMRKTL